MKKDNKLSPIVMPIFDKILASAFLYFVNNGIVKFEDCRSVRSFFVRSAQIGKIK